MDPRCGNEPFGISKSAEIVGWDDGSPLIPPSSQAPSAVQDLAFGQSEGPDEVTVTWNVPAIGSGPDAKLAYTFTMNDGTSSTKYLTTSTNQSFSGLVSDVPYTFWVWAFNGDGAGSTTSISGTPTNDQTPTFSAVNE